MQQIVNITDARNNLSRLITKVAQDDSSVVIIRDSIPQAVILPYKRLLREAAEKEELWRLRFARIMTKGKKIGKNWAKKKGLKLQQLTEEALYELVEKA